MTSIPDGQIHSKRPAYHSNLNIQLSHHNSRKSITNQNPDIWIHSKHRGRGNKKNFITNVTKIGLKTSSNLYSMI